MSSTNVSDLHTDNKMLNMVNESMDLLFTVMDGDNDVTLTDHTGKVIRVSDSYWTHYAVTPDEVIGKTVYELQDEGVFDPSVTALVIERKQKVTIMQKNRSNENVLTTGVPIFDKSGQLKYVISFNAIDIAGMSTLKENYDRLQELVRGQEEEIKKLRYYQDIISNDLYVTRSEKMLEIKELALRVSDFDTNILITGETGVGKSLLAKLIHNSSNRRKNNFVEINCGTIPMNLIESELFGYEPGAFTGASDRGKKGLIEQADGGTLLLDEVGELPLNIQVKLLNVIQTKEFARVGGLTKKKVDFRLIAATNKDLKAAIEQKTFREDLFYRLNVISLEIPPLRERPEDITPLAASFLEKYNSKHGRSVHITEETLRILERFDWPGNIRQLENVIERLVITCESDMVKPSGLPQGIIGNSSTTNMIEKGISLDLTYKEMIDLFEEQIFKAAIDKYHTSVAVSRALDISQSTANRKMRKYGSL